MTYFARWAAWLGVTEDQLADLLLSVVAAPGERVWTVEEIRAAVEEKTREYLGFGGGPNQEEPPEK